MAYELIVTLMRWAAALSGYEMPALMPEVRFIEEAEIVQRSRGCAGHSPCPILGLYQGGRVLYVRAGLDEARTNEVTVHEMTHYLQALAGRTPSSCQARWEMEKEAYLTGNRFVFKVYGRYQPLVLPPIECHDAQTKAAAPG